MEVFIMIFDEIDPVDYFIYNEVTEDDKDAFDVDGDEFDDEDDW